MTTATKIATARKLLRSSGPVSADVELNWGFLFLNKTQALNMLEQFERFTNNSDGDHSAAFRVNVKVRTISFSNSTDY